jgi:hypothetical protein
MKTAFLSLLLGTCVPAHAGYADAVEALVNVDDKRGKELDALLAKSGEDLLKDDAAVLLLGENQPALDLFRGAANAPNDGYLFAPRPEKPTAQTPLPKYGAHVKIFKLLLLDARIKLAQKRAEPAHADLLAAAGFMAQLSGQKFGALVSSLVQQLCLQKSFAVFSEGLRGKAADAAFLKALSERLAAAAAGQDYMRAALLEEGETLKNTVNEGVTFASTAPERAKLPFWKRPLVEKLQDKAYFDAIHARFGAAVDARTAAAVEAFRANDPSIIDAFIKKQQQELQARKEARDKRGAPGFMELFRAGPPVKDAMVEAVVDGMLGIAAPDYSKLLPRCNLAAEELGVLRAAAAVKLYQAARRRPPDSLEELVPAFLAEVPKDPFNKFAPLAYSRKGNKFLVYGFGPDGKDDKGLAALDYAAYTEDPAKDAGDVVFSD